MLWWSHARVRKHDLCNYSFTLQNLFIVQYTSAFATVHGKRHTQVLLGQERSGFHSKEKTEVKNRHRNDWTCTVQNYEIETNRDPIAPILFSTFWILRQWTLPQDSPKALGDCGNSTDIQLCSSCTYDILRVDLPEGWKIRCLCVHESFLCSCTCPWLRKHFKNRIMVQCMQAYSNLLSVKFLAN